MSTNYGIKDSPKRQRTRVAAKVGLPAIGVPVLLIVFVRGARYWLYYKPLYTIFDDSLFLPFWWHVAGFVFGGCVLVLLGVWALELPPRLKAPRKGIHNAAAVFAVLAGVLLFSVAGRAVHREMPFIESGSCLTAECDVNTLREIFKRRGNIYKIYPEGVEEGVKMDYYQYRELRKLRQKHINKVLRVHYLPSTKIMLRYE